MSTGTNILDSASEVLHDESNTRWARADLLAWLNEGLLALVTNYPPANVVKADLTLVEGVEQSAPAACIRILDITRNVSGNAIRKTTEKELDRVKPSWPVDTASATVKHFMYEPDDPTNFKVYPPQPASAFGSVRIEYSGKPTALATEGATVTVDEVFDAVLVDYVLHRAYLRDVEFAGMAELATGYLNRFETMASAKFKADEIADGS